MKRGIFSLRRLRWKLTLSYTLVTVVALLALELLVLSALVTFLSSELWPAFIAQQIRDSFAPQLEEPLAQDPPDGEALKEALTPFPTGSEVPERDVGMDVALDQGSLFVLDEKRHLLASNPGLLGSSEGARFDTGSIGGLTALVDAAFKGEENSGRLSTNTPEGLVLTVTPIEDDKGRVAGVLVGTFRMPNLTGPLLVTLGASAVALAIPAGILGAIFGFLTAWGLTRRLQRLARAAQAWSRGDFSVAVTDRSKDELGQLSRELNQMAVRLENLMQARGELATLEARNRFARDLHDSVKQQVFATSLQVAAARAVIERDTGAAQAHLAQAEELVRGAQKELNVLIHEMRPAALEGKGLAAALRDYVKDWSSYGTEIEAEVHVRGEREIPLDTEQALFRVAQEALANVAKHSGADHVEVDLVYDAHTVRLRVADDGSGFDPGSPGDGFGLQSMRERAARLGGRVVVESAPGKGTRVECVCPLAGASSKEVERP